MGERAAARAVRAARQAEARLAGYAAQIEDSPASALLEVGLWLTASLAVRDPRSCEI